MKLRVLFVAVVITASAVSAGQSQLPKSQLPELGRPTKETDEVPLFNFEQYFPGKWKFEWEAPEGIFGTGGRITGTTVYKVIDNKFFEAETEATGPDGPFKTKELIAYHRDNKVVSRYVTDSRGFSYMQIGRIGGDLGGYFSIYYESSPFTYKGKSVRVRSTTRLLSPVSYRVQTTVSVDGGPFMNYATPIWQKEISTAK